MVSQKVDGAIYGKPPLPCQPLPAMNHPVHMDMDDLDELGQALDFSGSVRDPSSASSVGILPQTSTMK